MNAARRREVCADAPEEKGDPPHRQSHRRRQRSVGSHDRLTEARQTMPDETTLSGGHEGAVPEHTSGMSQVPWLGRHTTPVRYCGGQSALAPVQRSGASQTSVSTALNTCVAG